MKNALDEILIEDRPIGAGHPPWIVAEMSGNHNQSLKRALQIVDAAAEAGAHALKLQTYTADTMTLNLDKNEFFIDDPQSLWKGNSLYNLYQQAHTPWEWHKPIFDHCKKLGMISFSSPFDETAVDFLEDLNVPCYKIASFENTDIRLIRKVAKTGKPIIISTGMASLKELEESISAAKEAGCQKLVLLKCTSAYPASPDSINLRTIPHIRETFGCQVGLSDHTMGTAVAIAAVALGVTVIEKHFTLSRSEGGVDSAFSLEPEELSSLVTQSKLVWQAMGNVHYGATDAEKKSLTYRRSLYIAKDIKAGEPLTRENLKAVRPGLGLPTKYFDSLLGKSVRRDVKQGTALTWELIDQNESS